MGRWVGGSVGGKGWVAWVAWAEGTGTVPDCVACGCEDHPVTCRDDKVCTFVELGASRPTTVSRLTFFSYSLLPADQQWHASDTVEQKLLVLIQIWFWGGTSDQVEIGGVAAMVLS